jgi:diaminopimelate decarboxylase
MAKLVSVITTDKVNVGGGAPIFYAKDREDLQKISHLLEKVLDCAAHEVHEDLFIIVDRHQ